MTALASTKHFGTTWEWQKERVWGGNGMHLEKGRDWVGKTVGVLGYGSIGRQGGFSFDLPCSSICLADIFLRKPVARLFTALGSHIHAYTASPRSTPHSRHDTGYIVPGTGDPLGTFPTAWYSGTAPADLHAFLRSGLDLLVVCLPLTPATLHILGKAEFDMLASACPTEGGPYVANISRGKILDQPALVAALNAGTLAGAMLDVADPEPLPKEDELWGAKNVVITPHVSGLGVEYTERAWEVVVGNLKRREKGEGLWNEIRRGRGY
jgi:phosphoglycerate dehydrogenase-like enzyme